MDFFFQIAGTAEQTPDFWNLIISYNRMLFEKNILKEKFVAK